MPSTVALAFAALLRGQVPWDLLAGTTPLDFRVDTPARLDEFLNATMGVPLWKIAPLLEQHAVLVTRDSAGVSCVAATPLRTGDKVRITSPLPAALTDRLQALADAGARDVALVPPPKSGTGDGFIGGFRPLLEHRPKTIWLNPPLGTEAVLDSLEEFVHAVTTDTDSTAPIRDVLMVSHANPSGALFVRLRGSEEIAVVTYERLETAVTGGFLRFPPGLFDPRPLDGGSRRRPRVILHGCDVGRAVPFLAKLKEVFGGEVDVLAPRHHDVMVVPDGGGLPFESLAYRFDVAVPGALRRADLLAALQRRTRAAPSKSPIRRIDDTIFPNADIDRWLPATVPSLSGSTDFAKSNKSLPWSLPFPPGSISLSTELSAFRRQLESPDLSGFVDPGPAGRKALVKRRLVDTSPIFADSHPFPAWVRFGQDTLDEFMDTWDIKLDSSSSTLNYLITRIEYELIVPVTAPGSTSLLVNRYTGNPAETIEQLDVTNPALFGSSP
jgi:hypothetical protein